MFGLPILDILVIVVYFAGMLAIGFWAMYRIKNREDYFLGGRRFGKMIQIFASFGQATSVSNATGTITTTMVNGISGIWSSLLYVFGTPVYWLTTIWYRRLRILTMGDFFVNRYGSKVMAGVYSVISVVGLMVIISLGFNAMGKTAIAMVPKTVNELTRQERIEYDASVELGELEASDYALLTDQQKTKLDELRLMRPRNLFPHISKEMTVLIVCVITLIYSVAGGLEAAFVTDLIQGIFIILLSVLLVPFAWVRINALYGGSGFLSAMKTVHVELPESFFEVLGTPTTIDFTWYYILAVTVMVTLNLGIQANQLTTSGSAKDEYTARFGFITGLYMKRVVVLLWGLFGLFAILLYNNVRDPDLVFGVATVDLLGGLKLGLVGLMIACLMAALMSTASCLMISSSALLTHNLYRPLFSRISEKHYVLVGRFSGAIVLLGGAWIALQFESIFQQLKFSWEITAIFVACFWLGMVWRRPNRIGAWASIIVTSILFFLLPVILPAIFPSLRSNQYLAKQTDPQPIVRQYRAHQMDLQIRDKQIETWDKLNLIGKARGTRPAPLVAGQRFERVYQIKPKSVFWMQGVKRNDNGEITGCGMLNIDLVLLDKMGIDLSKFPYALNESIRVLFRVIIPFGVLIIFSLVTRPDDKERLDRFFVKMKTPVHKDHDADKQEIELSYANPQRFDHLKLFPNSQWEFSKWDKTDVVGFLISVAVAVAIVGLLYLIATIGS
ncbi:MAG: sodium:solute symporter family protein [Phycisphaerae bacterium]|jgi:SSS family solute:Na+ symporter